MSNFDTLTEYYGKVSEFVLEKIAGSTGRKASSDRRSFGSAVRGIHDDETSDLDFVVRFADRWYGYADRYLDSAQVLEDLLGRDVDLVTERSIQNPFFERSADDSRRVIYDRSDVSVEV